MRNTIADCRKRWQRYAAGGTVRMLIAIAIEKYNYLAKPVFVVRARGAGEQSAEVKEKF